MIKIYYDLEKERNIEQDILESLKKNKKSLSEVFDKAYFIEKVHDSLADKKAITIRFDQKVTGYNILEKKPPRMIIQDNGRIIDIKGFFEKKGMVLSEKNDEYMLTIKKTENQSLDLNLKLDHDKTIDLSLLSDDKRFKGIRTYYYNRRLE